MYGWVITNGAVKAKGTNGAIVRFNLSNYEPTKISQIVLFNNATNPPVTAPFTAGTTKEVLYGYLDSTSTVPDAAFCLQEDDLDVFLKTGVYDPTDTDLDIGIFWEENAENVNDDSANVDCPQEALSLLKSLVLQETYKAKGKPVPFSITNAIAEDIKRLGLDAASSTQTTNV